jgi:hypothetical protein
MDGRTARFFKELKKSHRIFSYVDCTSATNETIRLVALAGQVDADRTASVRRRLSMTCTDPLGELTPERAGDILTPYGTELRPYMGVIYDDGEIEVCALGVFRLSTVTLIDDSGTGTASGGSATSGGSSVRQVGGASGGLTITMDAYDLSRTVSRDKFTTPYTIAEGTNVIQAIKSILSRTFPDLSYDAMGSNLTVAPTQVFDAGEDPWAVAQGLAMSLGAELYFNILGNVTIEPSTDIRSLTAADFEYIEGEGSTMLGVEKIFSDEPGYNGVVVIGESPADDLPPVTATAWDSDPHSLTYHLGPYGEVPMFLQDQLVKTTEEAQAMANAVLSNILGFVNQLNVDALTNPAFECGDVVRIVRARSKIADYFVVDAFTVPFSALDSQTLNVRQTRRAS